MRAELEPLFEMIDDLEIAMMTTRRPDGHLEARAMPGLRESLVTTSWLDPRDFEGDLRTRHGAAFGPEPVLTQSAWFRFHNRSPDVRGLYFVGAGTHPGAGVPGVLCSAKVLERVVERPARPVPLPAPVVPKKSLPWRACAIAISSFIDLMPSEGEVDRTLVG